MPKANATRNGPTIQVPTIQEMEALFAQAADQDAQPLERPVRDRKSGELRRGSTKVRDAPARLKSAE